MAYLGKEYKFVKQEKFDEFLRAVNVPEEQIAKIVEFKSSSAKVVKEGDKYKFITTDFSGTKEIVFESGVEFEDTIGDKKTPMKTTFTVDGNVINQVVKTDKGSATFKREFNGDDLVVTITSPQWDGTAHRYYKA